MKALEQTQKIAASPFVMQTGPDSYAVLFRYGVAVLFGMNAIDEAGFITKVREFVIEPVETPEVEECQVHIDRDGSDSVEPSFIRFSTLDVYRIQILADVLAKSAILSFYEKQMARTFDAIEPIANELQSRGPSGLRSRALLRHIGTTLSIQRRMVGQVEVGEKPEVLWERPHLERLFAKMEDEFEITERNSALRSKLELVYKTAETLLGLLQERRTLHVEWYIVILIVFEILLSLSEKIFGL